ncbi:MAG: ferrous iron transport protein A [Bacteroidia bacterium]|nr:ferrous iron transport protein A [Bacteroidia bacterium]
MNLTQLKEGEKCKVVDILGGRNMIKRLEALGIRTEIEITKINSQFLRGPVIIQIGNTQVAVGYGMAVRIIVEPIYTKTV